MKREKKLNILTIIPLITEAIALIFLPSEVPVHYNMNLQVTGYGSKYTLLFLGGMVLLFGMLMSWIYKESINKEYEKVIYWLSVIALGISNIINLFALYGSMFMGMAGNGVAIIGGADGPTAIFLAGELGGVSFFWIIISLLLVIGSVLFIFKKKKY